MVSPLRRQAIGRPTIFTAIISRLQAWRLAGAGISVALLILRELWTFLLCKVHQCVQLGSLISKSAIIVAVKHQPSEMETPMKS